MVLALIFKTMLPRALGPSALGNMYYAESFASIVMSFATLGMGAFIAREIPRRTGATKSIVQTAGLLTLAATVPLLAGVWLALDSLGKSADLQRLALVMGGYIALQAWNRDIMRKATLGHNLPLVVARGDVLAKVCLVLFGGAAIWLTGEVLFVALSFLASEIVTAVWLGRHMNRGALAEESPDVSIDSSGSLAAKKRKSQSRQLVREMVVVSAPFFLSGAIEELYRNVDATILEHLLGTRSVGLYGASVRILGICLFFVPILTSGLQPVLSEAFHRDERDFAAKSQRALRLLLALSIPLTALLVAAAEPVIRLLYGAEFGPSVRALVYLAPTVCITYVNILLSSCSIIATRGRRMIVVMILGAVLNAALNFALIPVGEAMWGDGGGGAMASLITLGCEVLVVCFLIHYLRKWIWSGAMLRWFISAVAVIATGMVAVDHMSGSRYASLAGIGNLVFSVAAVFILGLVSTSEIRGIALAVRNLRAASRETVR